MESLKNYKELKYGEINKFIREATNTEKLLKDNPNDVVVRDIVNIDSMMYNDGKLNKRWMYRGFSKGLIPVVLEVSDGVIVNKSYSSSTFLLDNAKKFIDTETGCCVLMFVIPSDIKYYEYKGDNNETEVLIQRNTQFIIDRENSTDLVYVAVLRKWEEPNIPDIKQIDRKMIEALSSTLSNDINVNRIVNMLEDELDMIDSEDDIEEEIQSVACDQGITLTPDILSKAVSILKEKFLQLEQ